MSIEGKPDFATVWSVFKGAALKPSTAALTIALLVPSILFGLCLAFITPGLMASSTAAYFSSGAWDDYTDLTSHALAISFDHSDQPVVIILGASDTRESITNHAAITEIVHDRTGLRPVIYNLASSDQTFWEMAAIIDQIPADRPAVIVMGLGAGRFSMSPGRLAELIDNPRLGFRSTVIDDEAQRAGLVVPSRTDNYFIDNAKFFLSRLPPFMENVATQHPRKRRYNLYLTSSKAPESRWQEFSGSIQARLEKYEVNFDSNMTVLSRILDRLSDRPGQSAVFLVPPKNPRDAANGLWAEFYRMHLARLEEISQDYDVPLWMLDDEIGIKEADFYDASHLNDNDVQYRYTMLLAERIAALFASTDQRETGS